MKSNQKPILNIQILSKMINYSYLSPPTKGLTPPTKSYIFQRQKPPSNKPIRRIFKNVPYQQFQIEAVSKLKEYLKSKQPNIRYADDLLLRVSYMGNFLLSESVQIIKKYCDFHHNDLYTLSSQKARLILQSGAIYSYGRDYDYHPLIFLVPNKIDLKKYVIEDYLNATQKLLKALEENMLAPGIIEKWNVIVDFAGKKVTIDKQIIDKTVETMTCAYPYRLKKLFFINTNGFQPSQTILAMEPVSISASQLVQHLPASQLQMNYGGNLSNLVQFWPIHSTNKHQEESILQMHDEKQGTQYQSVLNDGKYFDDNDKTAVCDLAGSKCMII